MSQDSERCGSFVVESKVALTFVYTDVETGASMTLTASGEWQHLAQHIEELTFAAYDAWLESAGEENK